MFNHYISSPSSPDTKKRRSTAYFHAIHIEQVTRCAKSFKNNTDYKISRNCGYYFSSFKNRYRTLVPQAKVPLLLQLLDKALCVTVKVFIKITETVECKILNYSSKSGENRFLNKQRHQFQRAFKKYPVSEPLDIKLCAEITKYFKTVKSLILNDTLTITKDKLTWLVDVNKKQDTPISALLRLFKNWIYYCTLLFL